ncbi:glycosyltransferase family 4 protein [Shewanella amazonensis]|uniref:Glycosyl transferase, group 1 family protein n=1 Tax=Shewanella amazonensis (strain ATCC BAA-1098 / SB2B) TaxID=326297 RepID=A1S1R5_SHEAM|nr:glycosyltransferase family 4 protein [Shewanella amazonensis]ABL98321.1 glycosyl transferase, group 1 family protein [Shewanella amazonensis SB2B]
MSKIKVALLVDEYFGGAKTKYGGYGFLARHLVAKHLPDDQVDVDVLLKKDCGKVRLWPKCFMVDGIRVYKLAARAFDWVNNLFLRQKNYDVFLSIEMTTHSYRIFSKAPGKNKKLLFWIQDPRPTYEWDEIQTVKLFPEPSYWDAEIYDFVNQYARSGNVRFISQAKCLDQKARDLYRLPANTSINYLPNPIEIDETFDLDSFPKQNSIIFLGRIESVKRGWLFAEIAKAMPQCQFYMLGQAHRQADENNAVMSGYQAIPNLHFVGHVEGEQKNRFLKEAKVLVNTSIHEALPISFLEALSYGTLLVSCQNPDELASKFGVYTGKVLGDGFDKVELFVAGINQLLTNDDHRHQLAKDAIAYIKEVHSLSRFTGDIKHELLTLCASRNEPVKATGRTTTSTVQ